MQKIGHTVMIPIEMLFNGRALQIARLFHRTRGKFFYLPTNALCNRIIKRTYHNMSGKKTFPFIRPDILQSPSYSITIYL